MPTVVGSNPIGAGCEGARFVELGIRPGEGEVLGLAVLLDLHDHLVSVRGKVSDDIELKGFC